MTRKTKPHKYQSKFNSETVGKILTCIRQGNFRATAAQFAGITAKTFSLWMSSDDERYKEFQKAVTVAEAEVEARFVDLLLKHGEKDAKWAAWWLERKFPRWNNAVHRWELQILQKQVKELNNVIKSIQIDQTDSSFDYAGEADTSKPPENNTK